MLGVSSVGGLGEDYQNSFQAKWREVTFCIETTNEKRQTQGVSSVLAELGTN